MTTLDTVATETPAAWAMSAKVVRLGFGRIGSSQLYVHRCGEPPVGAATMVEPVNRTATWHGARPGRCRRPLDPGTSDDPRAFAPDSSRAPGEVGLPDRPGPTARTAGDSGAAPPTAELSDRAHPHPAGRATIRSGERSGPASGVPGSAGAA
ncbi:hypothetical protein SVIO_004240 [Streptomyces violaceusniger]|uniref:Uncharacterized protein n=1 Tax=Streptomyces violaceusniger TaxID=68280 RepID=A0A4D4KKY4_STRVO|nr:hypothetical protein SVIO_004240 [Streptomyces violaceusniger]